MKYSLMIGGGILGGLFTFGFLKRATMPLFSAMRFLKYVNRRNYLTKLEKSIYIERVEETEIAFALKHERESFFVIAGPKKVGKSFLLKHMADTTLKKQAIYLKVEQKLNCSSELCKIMSKAVGYHHLYEDSLLTSVLFPWKWFQSPQSNHHNLALYLEEVGRIYQKLNKGKLPILIIDEVSSLARDDSYILDDLGYMAKSLAESKSMTFVFGLLDGFGPNVLDNTGYNMNKQIIYLNYLTQTEVMRYANKLISKHHPLRKIVLDAIAESNKKIYGGNFQYLDTLINQLEEAKDDKDIEVAKKYTEEKVLFDINDELKKTFFKDQAVHDSSVKFSLIKAFLEINKKGAISLDRYLSFFEKADQPIASQFLYDYMILKEQRDVVKFRGPPIQYYLEKNVLNKYASDIAKEKDMNKCKEMKEYNELIEGTIVQKPFNAKWSDLIGRDNVKQKMIENIVLPTLNPSLFTGIRSPARGILFHGPPGTGKTMLAHIIASECGDNITFFKINSSIFATDTGSRQPDKVIKALFAIASERQPSIIFIDEMNTIMSKRGPGDTEESRRLKNEFLIQFEGVASSKKERVVVIGATNRIFDIDDAVLRRFQVRVYLDLPSAEIRRKIIETLAKKVKNELSVEDYDVIVKNTEHFSYPDLAALYREASYEPIREIALDKLMKVNEADIRPIKLQDFMKALGNIKKSSTEEQLLDLCESCKNE